MSDIEAYAMAIHNKDDTELNNRRTEIFDYLLKLGVDLNVIMELSAIDMELGIRSFTKSLGLS